MDLPGSGGLGLLILPHDDGAPGDNVDDMVDESLIDASEDTGIISGKSSCSSQRLLSCVSSVLDRSFLSNIIELLLLLL